MPQQQPPILDPKLSSENPAPPPRPAGRATQLVVLFGPLAVFAPTLYILAAMMLGGPANGGSSGPDLVTVGLIYFTFFAVYVVAVIKRYTQVGVRKVIVETALGLFFCAVFLVTAEAPNYRWHVATKMCTQLNPCSEIQCANGSGDARFEALESEIKEFVEEQFGDFGEVSPKDGPETRMLIEREARKKQDALDIRISQLRCRYSLDSGVVPVRDLKYAYKGALITWPVFYTFDLLVGWSTFPNESIRNAEIRKARLGSTFSDSRVIQRKEFISTPTLEGVARGVDRLKITLQREERTYSSVTRGPVSYESDLVPVTQGRWTVTVVNPIEEGDYRVEMISEQGEFLGQDYIEIVEKETLETASVDRGERGYSYHNKSIITGTAEYTDRVEILFTLWNKTDSKWNIVVASTTVSVVNGRWESRIPPVIKVVQVNNDRYEFKDFNLQIQGSQKRTIGEQEITVVSDEFYARLSQEGETGEEDAPVTFAPANLITVTAPNGGETFVKGDVFTAKWTLKGKYPVGTKVCVNLTEESTQISNVPFYGATGTEHCALVDSTKTEQQGAVSGELGFRFPTVLPAGKYRVRAFSVSSTYNASLDAHDVSDSTFSIVDSTQ